MASPVADSYSCASGGVISGGVFADPVIVGSVWTPARDGGGNVLASNWQGLPLNTWLDAGTQVLNDVIETPHYLNSSGGDSSGSITNAWGGAAWDYINQRMFIAGGGHGDGSACETGIYQVDAASLRFSRIRDRDSMSVVQGWSGSALVPSETWSAGFNVPLQNGVPGSQHTYHNLLFVPPSVMGNASGGIFYGAAAKAIWNLDTQAWTTTNWFNVNHISFDDSNMAGFVDGSKIYGPYSTWYHWRYDLTQTQATDWSATSFGKFETGPISQNKEVRSGGGFWGVLRERREEVSLSSSGALVRCRYGSAIDASATVWNSYCDTITLTSSDGSHTDFSAGNLNSEAMFCAAGSAYDHATETLYIQANSGNLYAITGFSGNTWTTQKIAGTGALHASWHGDYGRFQLATLAGKKILLRVTSKTTPVQVMRIS